MTFLNYILSKVVKPRTVLLHPPEQREHPAAQRIHLCLVISH